MRTESAYGRSILPVPILPILLLVSLSILSCSPPPEELPAIAEASFIDDLLAQNSALRAENAELRRTLLLHEETITAQNETLAQYFERLRAEGTTPWEFPHPATRVEDIRVRGSEVIIRVPGVYPVLLSDTNSMDPTLDNSSKVIVVAPRGERDIHVGDIVGYRCSACEGTTIMHRVVAIASDDGGTYYTLRGDNAPGADPERVRFGQIQSVVVGIIY